MCVSPYILNQFNYIFILLYIMYWTIYTKSKCLYCDKVKELLKGLDVVYINCDKYLTNEYNKLFFLKSMKNKIGRSYNTFPMVFYNGEFIGGYNECLEQYDKDNFNIEIDF